MSDVIDICGVLVHAKPDRLEQVKSHLKKLLGVEVHAATDNSRLIVTIDMSDKQNEKITTTMTDFHDIPGVLSAALIYQHTE